MNTMKSYYDILGLKQGATKEEIKKKYRQLAQQYHPDKHVNNPLGELAEEKFKEIKEAYEALMNGYTRESYNSANYSNSYSNVNAFNSLVDQIMISTENRMWSKVINLCNQAIEYNDQEPMIYVFKANALQNQEKYQAAISFYKIALTYNWNPHSSDLWNYALCYMELGKYSEAIPLVERVISIEGELPNCISHLAWCYESIGDYRTADDYWERLERIDPYNEMLQQRKQAMRVGNQYVSKSDAAVGACGICAILECLFDCC